jgi:hypothetical protein
VAPRAAAHVRDRGGRREEPVGAQPARRGAGSGLLLVVAVVGFLWMPAQFAAGDPLAWREEARSLLAGELSVPAPVAQSLGAPGQYFTLNERTGLYYSKYGIANSLMSLPPMWLERTLGLPGGGEQPNLLLFNLWQVALGVVLAALLYALSGRYSDRPAVRALFVAAAFYCTPLWFYQRAQTSEIYQTILFVGFFMAATAFLRPLRQDGPGRLDARAWACIAAAWACAAALVLTRIAYGLLLPILVLLAMWCATRDRSWRELRAPALGAALFLPPLAIVCLLGAINYVKFGAPWLTGYHQWRAETHWPVGDLGEGLHGFLFSPRFSIFVHFPLLLFALAACRRFARSHTLDAVAIASIFAVFLLLLAKTPSWAGEWTYGPRYLLPMLPVLALPFLTFTDSLIEGIASWRARAWTAAAVAVLAFSAYLQVEMNRLPFYIFYHARVALDRVQSPLLTDYFTNQHDAMIAVQLSRHRDDLEALPFVAEVKRLAPASYFEAYRHNLATQLDRGNRYLQPAGR